MDCSPPGFSIHGIFQPRVLEWGAIAFSDTNLYGVTNTIYIKDKGTHSKNLKRVPLYSYWKHLIIEF